MPNPAFKRSRSTAESNIEEMAAKLQTIDMPKIWFQKRKREFQIMDPGNTGVVSKEGQEVMAQRFEKYTNMTPEEGKEMREILMSFWIDVLKSPEATVTLEHNYKMEYVLRKNPDFAEDLKMFLNQFASNVFKIIDTNHDGIISRQEWRIWFKCINVHDEKIADDAFDTIDLNNDGIMSYDEFLKGVREYNLSLESDKYDMFLGPLPEV